jgi:CTLH/CRA C-terminal to LisH motif domain
LTLKSACSTFWFAENLICFFLCFAEGFKEAAEKFQVESGIDAGVDLSTLDNRILIREAINSGKIQESISLVNQLHPELLDNDRYLYFHLQQLHLIELIRDGKIEDALRFAQNKIAEAGETNPEGERENNFFPSKTRKIKKFFLNFFSIEWTRENVSAVGFWKTTKQSFRRLTGANAPTKDRQWAQRSDSPHRAQTEPKLSHSKCP